jgi:hypothetical protein
VRDGVRQVLLVAQVSGSSTYILLAASRLGALDHLEDEEYIIYEECIRMPAPRMIQPTSSDTKSQELRQLREILTKALGELDDVTRRNSPNGSWFSLDMPINCVQNQNHWEPHQDPEVQRLSNLVVSAAYQLINLVREPFASLADAACGVRSFYFEISRHFIVSSCFTSRF